MFCIPRTERQTFWRFRKVQRFEALPALMVVGLLFEPTAESTDLCWSARPFNKLVECWLLVVCLGEGRCKSRPFFLSYSIYSDLVAENFRGCPRFRVNPLPTTTYDDFLVQMPCHDLTCQRPNVSKCFQVFWLKLKLPVANCRSVMYNIVSKSVS